MAVLADRLPRSAAASRRGFRIGELAKRVGLTTSAIRYYEAMGLLAPAGRTAAGYRLYEPAAVGRLEFLRRARALGLTLREVRQLLAGRDADPKADRDRLRHLVAHKLAETKNRVSQLQALERELEALYVRLLRAPGRECGHVGDCACWLPTEEEVKRMSEEVLCCEELCCPGCSCEAQPCDCSGCPCLTAIAG